MKSAFACLMFLALLAMSAFAQDSLLSKVSFEQKLDAQVPLNLELRDEQGHKVLLRDYFGKKPVVLSLVYYRCPMLCTVVLNGLMRALRTMRLNPSKDFDIVTVSFDPRDTPALAAAKKFSYVDSYRREGAQAGWHFLLGRPPQIDALARSVGFHYAYDPTSDQYAHPAGIVVLTPEGRVSRYLYGVEFSARDLRLALVEAARGSIGSPVDRLLLYCYHYNPLTGRYGLLIQRVLRLAAAATALDLFIFVAVLLRREKRAGQRA